ncbi:hypothetical protein WOY_01189 [Enterococcus faecium EnGen0372]|nr:hypothetical protein SKQ_01502 [Enterococcus faecium EnGen0171]EOK12539.1 hypothetical protein WOY_01189 [Enterococcus faecium EnGen0372]EOM39259.1 hypothetical protein SKS_01094 [Enterococcus faecium EnGen0172]RBS33155.1 hypothetical protein EB13_00649 [Enterococcus faecium]
MRTNVLQYESYIENLLRKESVIHGKFCKFFNGE